MTALPDPRERPTLTIPEAGEMFGLARSASYAAADNGAFPVIELSPNRRVVPTAALLRLLGHEDSAPAAPVDDATVAAVTDVVAELEEATAVALAAVTRLREAVAGTRTVARLLRKDEAGVATPATVTTARAVGGLRHDDTTPIRLVRGAPPGGEARP